jgi:hypothetical protein
MLRPKLGVDAPDRPVADYRNGHVTGPGLGAAELCGFVRSHEATADIRSPRNDCYQLVSQASSRPPPCGLTNISFEWARRSRRALHYMAQRPTAHV